MIFWGRQSLAVLISLYQAILSRGITPVREDSVTLPLELSSTLPSGNSILIARDTHEGTAIRLSFFSFSPLCIQHKNWRVAISLSLLKIKDGIKETGSVLNWSRVFLMNNYTNWASLASIRSCYVSQQRLSQDQNPHSMFLNEKCEWWKVLKWYTLKSYHALRFTGATPLCRRTSITWMKTANRTSRFKTTSRNSLFDVMHVPPSWNIP